MGGTLTNVHPSAANDFLLKEAQWFSVDHNHVGHFITDVFGNYKDWKVKGKRQGYFSRTNFSFEKMEEQLNNIFSTNVPELPKKVELKIPNLKEIKLPKKETVNG